MSERGIIPANCLVVVFQTEGSEKVTSFDLVSFSLHYVAGEVTSISRLVARDTHETIDWFLP